MEGRTIREFATQSRIHVALAVADVERSREFYEKLFGVAPSKVRSGYAKFEVAEPPVNLALNQVKEARGRQDGISHFGIEVKSTRIVEEAAARLAGSGLATRRERVSCCFADQEKVYVIDPDGHEWEVFVALADTPQANASPASACCATG